MTWRFEPVSRLRCHRPSPIVRASATRVPNALPPDCTNTPPAIGAPGSGAFPVALRAPSNAPDPIKQTAAIRSPDQGHAVPCRRWTPDLCGNRPPLTGSPSTRAARAHRGRMRTGCSFRGCGTRPAGSDSPRLSRNTPHASGNRGRITTEKWNSMGAKQAHREMLPAPCLQHSPNCGEGATHSFARQGPPRHNHRSPGCWAFLAQARTVRAKRVPQPAEGMPRASPADYEHSGKKTQGWEIVVCPPFPITKPPTGGK